MISIRQALKTAIVASVFSVVYGCGDQLTPPGADTPQPRSSVASAFGALEDVPAVTMDLPPSPRPWDTDDAALVAALKAEDGHAIVAFKLAASPRASEAAGRRAALPATAFEQGLQLLESKGAEILYVYRSFGAASVRIDPALGPELRRDALVDYLEPRQRWELAGTPAGANALAAMLAAAFAQLTPWGISMVRAPEAWSVTTGSGMKVLIIDTGVNPHEDLPAIPGANCGGQFGGCTDGPFFHGTHVAGSFLARNNTIGVVGVSHGVAGDVVYSWGACSQDPFVGCPNTQIAAGIDAGKFAGVKVISMSIQGPFDQGIANAVASAWATDSIVLVAAAGNNGGNLVRYPAGYLNVIGVSGVRTDKSFASSSPCGSTSNYGSHVDLAGPFWALSTVGTSSYEGENQGWCGTSMATPHVSGTATLVWAQNPTWTNQQVVDRLFATAQDLGTTGRDDLFGRGLVDAANALGVPPPPPPPPPSVTISGPTTVRPGATCTWFANASGGTPPYSRYSWTPLGDNSPELMYTNSGESFTVSVWVTDAAGASGFDSHPVTVSSGAPACRF